MIYSLVEDEFADGLHALNIQTRTPEEHAKMIGSDE